MTMGNSALLLGNELGLPGRVATDSDNPMFIGDWKAIPYRL